MIETQCVCPFGKMLFPQLHEFLLKITGGLSRVRVAGGNHTALARVVAEKFHRPNPKRFEFIRCAEQAIFAKRLAAGQLQIRPKTAADTLKRHFREPALNGAKTGFTRNRRPKSRVIVRKPFLRFIPQHDGKAEEIAQPLTDASRIVQWELSRRSILL